MVLFSEKPPKFWQAVSFALVFGPFSSTVLALRYHSVSVRGGGTPLALKECGRLPGSSMTIRLKEVFFSTSKCVFLMWVTLKPEAIFKKGGEGVSLSLCFSFFVESGKVSWNR